MELASKTMVHVGEHFEESLQGVLHAPTLAINKKSGETLWGQYKITEFSFDTFAKYHRNFWYILIDVRLFGFGVTIQCRRRHIK